MTVQYQGVWSLQSAAQLQSTQRWVTDPLFDYTTLLLQADDAANGSQNNTFLDSSSNAFAITRNGNTTQGSFTPFSLQPGAWSAYLTSVYGSSTFTSRTLFNGNSTIELWVYPNALSGQQTFVRGGGVNFGTNGARLRLDDGVNAGSVFESIGTIVPNVWNHVAVVRTSNTFTFYINGNLDSSNASISSFYTSNATDLNVGAFNSIGSNAFVGYLSNIRVSNVARTISVPTVPYSSDANTVWLIFQSNRFVDNSSNSYALTFVGTPSVQAFSPFAPQFQWTPSVIGGSGYFDGTTDYLQTPSSTTLQLGSSDFSIEWWEYRDTIGADDTPVTTGDYTVAFNVALLGYGGTSGFISTNGSSWNVFSGAALARPFAARSWNHYLYTRSGTAFRVFINGLLSNYATASGSVTQNNNRINVGGNAGGATYDFPGYISNVRVVKGSIPTAYQTSSTTTNTQIFTPPTAPVTTTSQGATTNDVILLLNFTNAGIYDGTMKNNLETVGNAQVSTAVVKYGSGSLAFDGTGDYLDSPSIINAQFGTGDFTIEGWLYLNSLAATQVLFEFRAASGATYGQIYITTGGVLRYYLPTDVGTSNTFSTGVWTHFAITRSVGILRMFIGGVQGYSNTYTTAMDATRLRIGADVSGGSGVNGYIDDLRITKGIARYTQNFIPPSVALPRQ